MVDAFSVELKRLTSALRTAPPSDCALAADLLCQLMCADSRTRELPERASTVEARYLPDALIAVAYDAQSAGVELERFAGATAQARRALW